MNYADKKRVALLEFNSVADWITPCDTMDCSMQASLSITNSQSLLRFMSIESVMPSNHLILSHPLLLLPSIFPNIRVFSNESVLHQVAKVLEFQLQHQSFQWIFPSLSFPSLVAQLVKNLSAMQETWVPSLGWEDPLEKGKATHSSILAWVTKSWTQLRDFHFFISTKEKKNIRESISHLIWGNIHI